MLQMKQMHRSVIKFFV